MFISFREKDNQHIYPSGVFCFRWIFFFGLFLNTHLHAQYFPILKWEEQYFFKGQAEPVDLLYDGQGYLWAAGNLEDSKGNCLSPWVLKIDTLGQEVARYTFPLISCKQIHSISLCDDGGIIYTGVSSDLPKEMAYQKQLFEGDLWVGKISALGLPEWEKTFGGTLLDMGNGISRGEFNEYVIAGITHSYDGDVGKNMGASDVWLVYINDKGKLLESKVIGKGGHEWATDVIACQNGDFLLVGYQHLTRGEEANLYGNGWLCRIDKFGKVVWERSISAPEGGYFTDVLETPARQIRVAGQQYVDGRARQFWNLHFTDTGLLLDQQSFGTGLTETSSAIMYTEGGGYLQSGYSEESLYKVSKQENPLYKGGGDAWFFRYNHLSELIWKETFGSKGDESCVAVAEIGKGKWMALGSKRTPKAGARKNVWITRIEEYPCEAIQADAFIRDKGKLKVGQPLSFKAGYRFGERFLWEFGDGTTSEEPNPQKAYLQKGRYEVALTVFHNENCFQRVVMTEPLKIN